jgi:hypothetical protein
MRTYTLGVGVSLMNEHVFFVGVDKLEQRRKHLLVSLKIGHFPGLLIRWTSLHPVFLY